jgi:ribosomal protein S18 acetylase RimI-like enzyme
MPEIKFSQNDITPNDLREINSLLRQLSSHPKTIDYDRISNITKNGIIFTARHEGIIVGMATLTFIYKPTAFFGTTEDVVVDENFRRMGIARKLMLNLIETAKEKKMDCIELTSRPSRQAANNFYLSLDFKIRETNCYRLTL